MFWKYILCSDMCITNQFSSCYQRIYFSQNPEYPESFSSRCLQIQSLTKILSFYQLSCQTVPPRAGVISVPQSHVRPLGTRPAPETQTKPTEPPRGKFPLEVKYKCHYSVKCYSLWFECFVFNRYLHFSLEIKILECNSIWQFVLSIHKYCRPFLDASLKITKDLDP